MEFLPGYRFAETATMKQESVDKYYARYSMAAQWPLDARNIDGVHNMVVIPAFAESEYLFSSLAALTENDPAQRADTLVICVINNPPKGHCDDHARNDNLRTLALLKGIIERKGIEKLHEQGCSKGMLRERERIIESGMRLSVIDAASEGRELSLKDAGVGLARKIGFDNALALCDGSALNDYIFYSLDADTLVEDNYLSEVRSHYRLYGSAAGLVSFSHVTGDTSPEDDAIVRYETFLRYYVIGLHYAGSPYAYHSIGSTMTFGAKDYLSVRGMNRKKAGEDFYFLNKLRKWGPVDRITATTVHPSSRVSQRVPFGTGKGVQRYLDGGSEESIFYDPEVFSILKEWLRVVKTGLEKGGEPLLPRACAIHPCLADYLKRNDFIELWRRIEKNSGGRVEQLKRHFDEWFDAFRTLKLIHHLTERAFPRRGMCEALRGLSERLGDEGLMKRCSGSLQGHHDRRVLLEELKAYEESLPRVGRDTKATE